ncbi:MAG: transglycosylase SLT domain-containing protein [Candidatus Aminicenantes bacterium]|nr:transglycosylase SLT domain-containing protein [Candidatus Aminicenantes bacterium]
MNYTNEYDELFKRFCLEKNSPFSYVQIKAQAIAESNLDPDARSPVGALGVMQIMPRTGLLDLGLSEADLLNPEKNIEGGIEYMRRLHRYWEKKIQGDEELWKFSLASYNAGMGNITKAYTVAGKGAWAAVSVRLNQITGRHSRETIGYIERIGRIYARLLGAAGGN